MPLSAHCSIRSRYSGCPTPIVPLSPLRQLMASAGPQMYSPRHHHPRCWSPPIPFAPRTHYHRRYALPHVFRFNGCWSSFRLLLFAFRRFRSFPRSFRSRFPRTGHLLTRSSSRCAHPQLGLFVVPACQGITFRRQFAISFSHRYQCFFIALHCFRVSSSCLPGSLPPGGSRTCVPKGAEGQQSKIYLH